MWHRSAFIGMAFIVWSGFGLLAQGQPQPASAPQTPKAFLQILNGIAPGPIDIEVNGKPLYSGIGPGQRISAFGVPETDLKVSVIDKTTGRRKTVAAKLAEGEYHTLFLAGDFELLAPASADGEATYRLFASVMKNDSNGSGNSVRVRLINGLSDKPIEVQGPNGEAWKVAPMTMEVAANLKPNLQLKAGLEKTVRQLYLSQEPPAKNLAIVFYKSGQSFAFRAMPESTAVGLDVDRKRSQAAAKQEAEEAAKGAGN